MSRTSPAYRFSFLAWLAFRGAAVDRGRAVLTLVVGAIGVMVLLGGAAVLPVAASQRDTTAALQPVILPSDPGGSGRDGLLIDTSREYYRGAAVSTYAVAVSGRSSLVPPGLGRVPGPGEVLASPELLRLLEGDAALRARFPGHVVGSVGREGLPGPRSLVAWVGVPAERLEAKQVGVTVGFQEPVSSDLVVPSAVRIGAPFMVIVFLVPLVALFVVVSLAGTARRSARLAALRLCGLTAGGARGVAAAESVVLGALSAVLGTAAFLVLAPRLAPVVPIGAGAWPDEVELVPWAAAAALLGIPLVAGAVVWRATGGAATHPLQASRAVPAEPPLPLRAVWVLLVGVLGLVLVDVARAAFGVDVAVLVLAGAILVSLVGVVVNARRVSQSSARWLGERARHVPTVMASRHVARHPRASSVVATGMALLVFFGGVLLSFFPLLSDVDARQAAELATLLGPDAVVATRTDVSAPLPVAGADGVSGVLTMRSVDEPRSSWISCPELARAASSSSCTGTLADRVVAQLRLNQLLPYDLEPARTQTPPPARAAEVTVVAFPAEHTDVEAIRTRLILDGWSDVVTTDERRAERQMDTETFRQATVAALACASLVALASLVTGLSDHVARQRRTFRMLSVMGVSRAQLGRSLLLQMALSVAPIVIIAWGVGMFAAVEFLRLNDTNDLTPSLPAALAVLACALLTPALAAAVAGQRLRTVIDDRRET